jgi:hypothetical protein
LRLQAFHAKEIRQMKVGLHDYSVTGVGMTATTSEYDIRKQKLARISESGEIVYKDRYVVTHDLDAACQLEDGTENVAVAGRIVSLRKMGKMAFGHIADIDGKFQFLMKKDFIEATYQASRTLSISGIMSAFPVKFLPPRPRRKPSSSRSGPCCPSPCGPSPKNFTGSPIRSRSIANATWT